MNLTQHFVNSMFRCGAILSIYFVEQSISDSRSIAIELESVKALPFKLEPEASKFCFQAATKKEPLTYYDMNLSAQVKYFVESNVRLCRKKRLFPFQVFYSQDHQTFFTCEADAGKFTKTRLGKHLKSPFQENLNTR